MLFRSRAAQATAGELARSIESLDGVLDARVHLARPDPDPAGEAPRRATASVLVRHRAGPPPVSVAQVQSLVAHAVEGLRADDVAVVLVARGPRTAAPVPLRTVAGITVAARDAPTLTRWFVLLVGLALGAGGLALDALRRRLARTPDSETRRD